MPIVYTFPLLNMHILFIVNKTKFPSNLEVIQFAHEKEFYFLFLWILLVSSNKARNCNTLWPAVNLVEQ